MDIIQSNPKWQRNFVMQVDGRMPKINGVDDPKSQKHFTISMPLTMKFDVDRAALASQGLGLFKIYNLAEETRRSLYHVWMELDPSDQQSISVFAGYHSQPALGLIFSGCVRWCRSYRTGVDWITEMECISTNLGMLSGNITLTIPKSSSGQPVDGKALIRSLLSNVKYTRFGGSGSIVLNPTRALSFLGKPAEVFQQIVGMGGKVTVFSDNGCLFALRDNEYLQRTGDTGLVITSDMILGSPSRDNGIITVKTFLEPRVFPGCLVKLSSRDKDYNGPRKCIGFKHTGSISAAECGEATTEMSLWVGSGDLVAVPMEV